jgi:hypothetical protein
LTLRPNGYPYVWTDVHELSSDCFDSTYVVGMVRRRVVTVRSSEKVVDKRDLAKPVPIASPLLTEE